MKNQVSKWFQVASIVIAICGGEIRGNEANGGPLPHVKVRVIDLAKVPPRTLQKAYKYVSYVFSQAGVSIDWTICTPGINDLAASNPCQQELATDEISLEIDLKKPQSATEDVLAFTFEEAGNVTRRTGVWFPAVENTATKFQAEVFRVLGAAVSHELGHVLLGANAHSRHGIMQPHWAREQMDLAGIGQLLFTPEQAIRIRAEASRSVGP